MTKALVLRSSAPVRAAALYLVADLRAQGLVGTGPVRRGLTAVFAVILATAVYSRAHGELHNAAGPRPVFLAAATVAMTCLLMANGLTAGKLSQTTGPAHLGALRILPISQRGAAPIVVLLTILRGLLFGLFFLAPVTAAGVVSAHSTITMFQCVVGLLVMPLLPAGLAGILARRSSVGTPALLVLAAMVLVTAGNLLGAVRLAAPVAWTVRVVAIPSRVLLGTATGAEFFTFMVVWILLTVAAYGLLGFAGTPAPDAAQGWMSPGRQVVHRVLRRPRPARPLAVLMALGLARVPTTVLVVLAALAAALGRLSAHTLAVAATPASDQHAAHVALVVAAIVAAGAAAFAVTLVLGVVLGPDRAEHTALGGFPLRSRVVVAAGWLTTTGIAALSGLGYLAAFYAGTHGVVGFRAAGWLTLGWLGACAAAAPFALLQTEPRPLLGRLVRNLAAFVALFLHVVAAIVGAGAAGSAGGAVLTAVAVDVIIAAVGVVLAVRSTGKGVAR